MIEIKSFTFNPSFYENTYVLYDETLECIIVDPGCFFKEEYDELDSFIEDYRLKPVKLINTHCHIDHVLGNAYVKNKYKIPLYIHKLDMEVLLAVKVFSEMYGFRGYEEATVDGYLKEGDQVDFGSSVLNVLFVPGHAPGHIALVSEEQNFAISGDVLFDGSIGRTDLPGGNYNQLIESIQTKLFLLDDEMIIYPGHGPTTTIRKEKSTNPFCRLAI